MIFFFKKILFYSMRPECVHAELYSKIISGVTCREEVGVCGLMYV